VKHATTKKFIDNPLIQWTKKRMNLSPNKPGILFWSGEYVNGHERNFLFFSYREI
jgi:hypothetical protein